MRLLILGNWHALSNAVQYAKAFRQEGHEVVTCGRRFTWEDGRRWKSVLLGMEWPPSNDEADAYIAQVLAESPTPDIMTVPRGLVAPGDYGNFDAVVVFDAYDETPLVKTTLPVVGVYGDTHTGRLAAQIDEAKTFKHVFVQFRRADLARFDHPSKHWLPAAADPDVWVYVSDMEKTYDVLFVGATDPCVHTKRIELIRFLKRELGDERVTVKHLFGERAALAMNRARIVFNRSLAGDLNMRIPEALCAGALLVTDDVDGLDALGGGDWWSYWQTREPESALEIVRALLGKPDRRDVGRRARMLVLEKHTYRHRARQILDVLFGGGQDGAQRAERVVAGGALHLGARGGAPAARAPALSSGRAVAGAAATLVSLVIPAYNHWEDCTEPLLRCLAELAVDDLMVQAAEVLVVDDGSSDETAALDRREFAHWAADIEHLPENRGFAAACNAGAALAKGKYLVFLNNDTEPEPGWLTLLVEELERGAGIVGPWLINPDPDPRGNHGATQSAGLVQAADGTWSNMDFLVHPPEEGPYEVKAVTGACLAIRRDEFWRLGGFDEGFVGGGGCEDVDLCLRARKLGLSVKVVPSSGVVHREGSTRFHMESGYQIQHIAVQIKQNQQRLLERWRNTDDVVASADRVPGSVFRGVRGASDSGVVPDGSAARPGTLTVVWEGPRDVRHGGSLAVINDAVCSRLAAHGIDVVDEPPSGGTGSEREVERDEARRRAWSPAVWVSHYWPGSVAHRPPPQDVRHWIVVQPWEGMVPVPEAWDATWDHPRFRCLITPSVYSRRFFWVVDAGTHDVRVVPNGVDLSVFTPDGPTLSMVSGTEGVFRVLFVGGLIERKGVDLLYEAWQRAFRPDELVRLVLKAQGTRTFYSHNTVRPPASLPNVQVIDDDGYTPEQMARLYRSCDVLVQPSRSEAFGLPVLEAMACGRAVIVPEGGPWDEYVPDAACLHWNRDPEALAKMFRWCTEHRTTLAEMGEAGRRAAQGYSWDAIAKKYADVIREVAGER